MPLIDDMVKKVPEEFRDMVRAHLVTLARLKIDEAQDWFVLLYDHRWKRAYEILNEKLTATERIGEQGRLNKMMEGYNQGNAEKLKMWSDFFSALLAIAITKASEEIIG